MEHAPPMDSSSTAPQGATGDRQERNDRLHQRFRDLRDSLSATIVGQVALVDRLLIALLADGHLLVEGAPGLAKTTAIRTLAAHLEADFARVQFTPDLLPADLTGTEVWRPQDGQFEFQPGPIFHPLLLADEINRAPAKVQSALLEAMGERQVTVGRRTYPLPELFLVMATQNPIEQEGTFPLPEAQLDRFLMHVRIGYPEADTETEILRLARERARRTLHHEPESPRRMPGRRCSPRARRCWTCISPRRSSATWSSWCWRPARPAAMTRRSRAASPGAQARADRSPWNAAHARMRGWPGAIT
jgi:MoxR-like ATPase